MRGLPLVLLVFLLAACGGGGGTPEPTGSDGFTRYEISAGDFSIAVPQTWHATTSKQIQKRGLERLVPENPSLARYSKLVAAKRSPTKLLAYDPVLRKRFATNVTVAVGRASKEMTAPKLREALVATARIVDGSKVSADDVMLPAGPGVRVDYLAHVVYQGKKRTIATRQYGLVLDGRIYILTYVTLPPFATEYDYAFKRSAASFRLVES